jgi:hypothetical protein
MGSTREMVSAPIQLVAGPIREHGLLGSELFLLEAEHLLLLGPGHQLGSEHLLLLASSDSLLGSRQVLGSEHLFLLAPPILESILGSRLWPGTWLDRLALVIGPR